MTSSKQRRLSTIFTSFVSPKEDVPEVPTRPKTAVLPPTPPTPEADVQSDPIRKFSQAQRRLKTLSTFFQGQNTKSAEDYSQGKALPQTPKHYHLRSSSTTPPDGKLHKPNSPPTNTLRAQDSSSMGFQSPVERGRQSDLMPPPSLNGLGAPRSVSSPASAQRPVTSYQSSTTSPVVQTSPPKGTEGKQQKTRWGKSRKSVTGLQSNQPRAWVIAGQEKTAYKFELLERSERVPELWNEGGDTYVYLFPRTANLGPSFKIPSILIADSQPLLQLALGSITQRSIRHSGISMEEATRNMAIRDRETPPYTPIVRSIDGQTISDSSDRSIQSFDSAPREQDLYFPIALSTDSAIDQANAKLTEDDIETLITSRNLFAFLTGQPLVATLAHPTLFTVFLGISQLLRNHGFSNHDGSTFGDAASSSFNFYIDELQLSDVRHSREKTIEAIILGERMRSTELYKEAFAHGVGKYEAIKVMDSPLFSMISKNTQKRMERASMELTQRQRSVGFRLTDFDFPSLWSGVAGSTSSLESRVIRFKLWKQAFLDMRRHVMSYYKNLFGSWPPKASSKKNNFVESGLNRLVLMTVYNDLSALYDLLVDRTSLTTRTIESKGVNVTSSPEDPLLITNTLRRILAEYDNSSPPVQPPVPFDIPNIPSRTSIDERHMDLPFQDQVKANNKRLKDHESLLLLAKSHNVDTTLVSKRPFVEAFKAFEAKAARHCNTVDVADQRYGHWLFMYVVLQSLPLLVVDAPGVRFNEGVEYFLCAPPRGGLPWMEQQEKRAWFGVAGGAGMVELPKDVVEYGVVATYHRSHCWIMAEQWGPATTGADTSGFDFGINTNDHVNSDADMPNFGDEDLAPFSPLLPPPGFPSSRPGSSGSDMSRRSRSGSPGPRFGGFGGNRPTSTFYGLEPLPFEPQSHARSRSAQWSGMEDLPPPPSIGGGERSHSRQSSGTEKAGISFDDILGGMESGSKKKKEKKRK